MDGWKFSCSSCSISCLEVLPIGWLLHQSAKHLAMRCFSSQIDVCTKQAHLWLQCRLLTKAVAAQTQLLPFPFCCDLSYASACACHPEDFQLEVRPTWTGSLKVVASNLELQFAFRPRQALANAMRQDPQRACMHQGYWSWYFVVSARHEFNLSLWMAREVWNFRRVLIQGLMEWNNGNKIMWRLHVKKKHTMTLITLLKQER